MSGSKRNKRYKIGYTQGVFDMFHVGHLSIINRASAQCERLIVGVNSDELVKEYKGKKPVINERDRLEIVSNIKAVYSCEIVDTLDKVALRDKFLYDAVFIGDDWKGSERWNSTEIELGAKNIDVVYLPHTPNISSSLLRVEIPNRIGENDLSGI